MAETDALSSITNGLSLSNITSEIQQYVVSPIAAFGIAGYIFSTQSESIAQLTAEITDHYTEDNTAVQDNIAIRPDRITLKGYVGEVVYSTQSSTTQAIQSVAQKLATVGAYLPALTAQATQIQQGLTPPLTAAGAISSVSNIYALVKNIIGSFGDMKNQQAAYNYFAALMKSKTLMSIQTPWQFMTNMAIEAVLGVQPESSKYVTEFSVSFKQMRFAQTTTTAYTSGGTGGTTPPGGIERQGDAAVQGADAVNQGNTVGIAPPVPVTISDLAPIGS